MIETIIDKILDTFVRLAPLWWIIAVVIVFFAVRFYYTSFKLTVDSVKNLPCKKDANYSADRRNAYSLITSMSEKLNNISKWIILNDDKMIDTLMASSVVPLGEKASPMKLNDIGARVLDIVNGTVFLNNNKDFFFKLIDEKEPKTALDVEQLSFKACFISTGDEIFNDIKNTIYTAAAIKVKNEEKEIDLVINISNTCYVLSITLRDLYLDEHPELKPKESTTT